MSFLGENYQLQAQTNDSVDAGQGRHVENSNTFYLWPSCYHASDKKLEEDSTTGEFKISRVIRKVGVYMTNTVLRFGII